MQKLSLLLICLLAACNLYKPFHQPSSSQEYIERATKCEHEGNLDCAIENLLLISDVELRKRKLCLVYLMRGGFTIDVYLKILEGEAATILGTLAQALLPWSETKKQDLNSAIPYCGDIGGKAGALLKAVSLITNCSLRIARTDTLVASSTSDAECNTPGNQDGRISRDDIISDSAVMCPTDALACREELRGIAFQQIDNQEVKEIYQALPASLTDSTVGISLLLIAIRSAIPSNT